MAGDAREIKEGDLTLQAGLGFAFFGSLIGFVAGIFVAVAHPVYLRQREELLKARESRKRMAVVLDGITKLIADKSEETYKNGGRGA